jgi:hypothetical protein
MTRKVLYLAMATVLSMAAIACSRDAEILAFVGELDSFTAQLVKTVQSGANPSSGVDAAQKYLDDNKAQLRTKLEGVRTVKNFQISEETKKKMQSRFTADASAVIQLEVQYVALAATDAQFRAKVEKLVNDYKDVLTK